MAAFKYVGRAWNVSAQVAGEELEAIERKNGSITPKAVVDAARPEDSALHKVFEWDDEKAAEQYRLSQASTFIRCIVKTADGVAEEPMTYKAFVNVNPTSDRQSKMGSYINTYTALKDPDYRAVILANAKRDMQVFKNRYSELKELIKVFDAIDEVLKVG